MKNENLRKADALEAEARANELGASIMGMGANGPDMFRLKRALELRAQASELRKTAVGTAK